MKKILIMIFILNLSFITLNASAHSGRTDSQGGHWDYSASEYHYHHGLSAHLHPNGVCPFGVKENTILNSARRTSQRERNTSNEYSRSTTNSKTIFYIKNKNEPEEITALRKMAQKERENNSLVQPSEFLQKRAEESRKRIEKMQKSDGNVFQKTNMEAILITLVFTFGIICFLLLIFLILALNKNKRNSSSRKGIRKIQNEPSDVVEKAQETKISISSQQIMCEKCGTILGTDSKYCNNCGTKLRTTKPQPESNKTLKNQQEQLIFGEFYGKMKWLKFCIYFRYPVSLLFAFSGIGTALNIHNNFGVFLMMYYIICFVCILNVICTAKDYKKSSLYVIYVLIFLSLLEKIVYLCTAIFTDVSSVAYYIGSTIPTAVICTLEFIYFYKRRNIFKCENTEL